MNTLRFAECSEGPDLLGKLRKITGTNLQPSRLLVFANDAKKSLPLSTRYWNLDTADSMISRTPD